MPTHTLDSSITQDAVAMIAALGCIRVASKMAHPAERWVAWWWRWGGITVGGGSDIGDGGGWRSALLHVSQPPCLVLPLAQHSVLAHDFFLLLRSRQLLGERLPMSASSALGASGAPEWDTPLCNVRCGRPSAKVRVDLNSFILGYASPSASRLPSPPHTACSCCVCNCSRSLPGLFHSRR